MIVTDNNKLICSSQTLSRSKEDSQYITTYKEISNAIQDERTGTNELRETSETMIVNENCKLVSSSQTPVAKIKINETIPLIKFSNSIQQNSTGITNSTSLKLEYKK